MPNWTSDDEDDDLPIGPPGRRTEADLAREKAEAIREALARAQGRPTVSWDEIFAVIVGLGNPNWVEHEDHYDCGDYDQDEDDEDDDTRVDEHDYDGGIV